MKKQLYTFKNRAIAGKLITINEVQNVAIIESNGRTIEGWANELETIQIVLERKFYKPIPLAIIISEHKQYSYTTRYDQRSNSYFAYYHDEYKGKSLIGAASKKGFSDAKRQLRKELIKAGYIK